jgi:hypothetical protein
MVAVTMWLALSNEHLPRPLATGLYFGYLTAAPIAIGLDWWMRHPASRFGPLLVPFGSSRGWFRGNPRTGRSSSTWLC